MLAKNTTSHNIVAVGSWLDMQPKVYKVWMKILDSLNTEND